ncbi:MAG TPA: methylated-DNA--[protein]-cysteine S-methyltransferase, partial [Acidiphilium sp.]
RHYPDHELIPGRCGVRDRLNAYFAGDLAAVDTITVRAAGTGFQHRVWTALRTIPPGTTTSYGELAARLGVPKASRAVGLANGANPISIVVPCHRVIGADGRLTGYGGGIERKAWLLDHEAHSKAEITGRQGRFDWSGAVPAT